MQTGVCYFPEHWPREQWADDIAAMAEAGFEYVRMGEFSWAVLEPERSRFEFDWLDETVRLVGEHGMQAVLCTPTATPPKWLVDEYPGILQEERDGTVRGFGSRRHYCFNSERYWKETERIVGRMGERYADHPAVAGWQIDNEYGCHGTVRCYCGDCGNAFREWLREKYGDSETLNEAWGTTFWSQRYGSIDEVDPPTHTVTDQHPSLLLDYYRFSSESAAKYNDHQARVLEAHNPEWFLAHNFMSHFSTLDAYDVAEGLDLVSWDSYPTGVVQDRRPGEATPDELRAGDPDHVSLDHDLYRGARDQQFWVMEQQPGDVNWPPDAPQPGEGAMRLWTHHAVAHGADAVLYFRWRRCLEGQEQYHAGLRKADGSPDRGYHDAVQAGTELTEISERFDAGTESDSDSNSNQTLPPVTDGITDASVDAPVALLHEYDNLWALDEQPHAREFDYWSLLDAFYGSLRAHSMQVDVVPPQRELDGYAAVVAPSLHLLSERMASRLETYVSDGGHLLLGPRTGSKDRHNKLRPAPQPGPLADLVGATVAHHESLPAQIETHVRNDSRTEPFRTWAEHLDCDEATPLWRYEMDGTADGKPAVVQNTAGSSTVTYCGVWPGETLADDIVSSLLSRADIPHTDAMPEGVRVAVRNDTTWVCNFSSQRYRLDAETEWLVGDSLLGEFDVAVADSTLVPGLDVERIRELGGTEEIR